MTPALDAALAAGDEVHALVKPASRQLLEPAYPTVHWIEWSAPWTVFRGKYRLWQWPWPKILRLIKRLRGIHFADGWSARPDPRDHLFLWLAGVRQRRSFRHSLSQPFLNAGLDWPEMPRHRSEDWITLARAAGLNPPDRPILPPPLYQHALPPNLANLPRPWVIFHAGAAQPTRRWPEASWQAVLTSLSGQAAFSLVLIPDPTGHGQMLRPLADVVLDQLDLPALVAVLGAADAVLAHDSGPAHLAAALGTPVFAVMGPNLPERFGPRHPDAAVLHDPQCPHFPCRDYCHFDEPRCLTHLSPERCLLTLGPWLQNKLRAAAAKPLNAGDYD
ncbi:glycosyltransferase family 9 protein [Cerasicoccus arenae]|uniref:glycosyltransferase family 9 protein n=1 Tax=Cerasicoccus arenae TaxID=424488 RepID=UPI001676B00C|nr:glycosyltransferase family 9 protein [Cerasicoccus arenae]MBK1858489.1 glycosyltransferase family 9 protein [Cerasicoccus arenae]